MRIHVLTISFFFVLFHLHAQTDTLVYNYGDTTHIDVQPQFPGGEEAFASFIRNRIIYPEDARYAGLQGMVYISYIIEKDGSLSTIKALQGKYFSASCEEEAIRVLMQSPRWKPALKDSLPIRTRRIQRIKFALTQSTAPIVTSDGLHLKKLNAVSDTTVFNTVSTMPEFRTENGSLYSFIQKNLVYPADAKEKKITGFVIVSFIVEKNGTVSNIHIAPGEGLYPSCDQAALDLVSKFPAWIPGDHKGTYVRVKQLVKIVFE